MAPVTVLAWCGLVLIVVPAFFGAMVTRVAVPWWDADPFLSILPPTAIGPTGALVLDLLVVLGCACAVASAGRVWVVGVVLFVAGAVGVLIHGVGDLEHLRVGSGWVAALAGGVGLFHLAQRPQLRAIAGGVLIGFVVMLASRGAVQVLVEHRATVAMFESQRELFYAARGWTEGSAAALVYERRLRQPEATGWFGLANVYASFAAVGAVGLLGAGIGLLKWFQPGAAADQEGSRAETITQERGRPGAVHPWHLLVMALGLLASIGALWMSGSKGGIAAGGLGVGLIFALVWIGRSGRSSRVEFGSGLVGPGVIGLVLGLVAVRGLIGERIGELSVLFRWFYMRGAVEVWTDHPLMGVGPGGFKDAWLLVRPALSPEEITSPHSAGLDWLSTLGVFGAAWCALVVSLAAKVGRSALGSTNPSSQSPFCAHAHRAWLPLLVLAALPVIGSVWVEMNMITPEGALARVAGLVGWFAAGEVLRRVLLTGNRWAAAGLAAAALAGLAHAQIELTGTYQGAAVLLFGLVGVAAGAETGRGFGKGPLRHASRDTSPVVTGKGGTGRVFSVVVVVVLVGVMGWVGLPRMARWEAALDRAVEPARRFALTRGQIERAGDDPGELGRLVRALGERLGYGMPRNASELEGLIAMGGLAGKREALPELRLALAARPEHRDTRIALTRLMLEIARGEENPRALVDEAIALAQPVGVGTSGGWAWYGTVAEGASGEFADGLADRETMLDEAIAGFEKAGELDPRGLRAAVRLAGLHLGRGEHDRARDWARRALDIDANLRLDPLRQMSEAQRAEMTWVAGGS